MTDIQNLTQSDLPPMGLDRQLQTVQFMPEDTWKVSHGKTVE
jgi:hypothetical protein